MFLILIALLLLSSGKGPEQSSAGASLKAHRRKPFAALLFTNANNLQPSDKTTCQWLSRLKHQSKICLNRRGLPESLQRARSLATGHCLDQFKFDQWNCSRREFFFKKIYRETAFMYSIASSAVMYQIIRSCSEGLLSGCKCGPHGKPSNSPHWMWGGCGDNTKFAKKFTKKFLQLKKRKKGDEVNALIRHNSEIGIKAVLDNEIKFCRCHGLSASCVMKVCWKKVQPFRAIAKNLKIQYHNALQIQHENKIHALKTMKDSFREPTLLYLESSPNFCKGTVNRHCNNTENCATLCCGRGFFKEVRQVTNEQCSCRFETKDFSVDCKECTFNETIFRCT